MGEGGVGDEARQKGVKIAKAEEATARNGRPYWGLGRDEVRMK